MSGILSVGGAGAVGVSGFYPVQINDSLRFEDGSSAYLNRTPSSAGNQKTWTWSAWVKRGKLAAEQTLFGAYKGGNDYVAIQFDTDDSLNVTYKNISQSGGSLSAQTRRKITNNLFRDVSAWYHIVVKFDSANTNCDIYVNGTEVTSFSVNEEPQNLSFEVNAAQIHYIGTFQNSVTGVAVSYFDGYMSDINFIDGTALDPTSFGQAKDGVWIPKSYSGSYGTNGFHLEFNSNTNDTSGNSNNWTANNISAHDYVPDSPTNNFATLNPLYNSVSSSYPTPALSEGNLAASTSSGSNWKTVPSTMYMSTGKWYAEVRVTYTDYVDSFIGFANSEFNGQNYAPSETAFGYQFHPSLGIRHNSSTLSAQTFTEGDIIGLALNLDDNEIKFYKNGSLLYTATSVAAGSWSVALTLLYTKTLYANFGQDSTFAGGTTAGGNSDANGKGDFKYAVSPSSHLALCSANLPEPTIIDASEYFNTVLYTGNDGTQSITGVGFQPDLVWLKQRSAPTRSHRLNDSVRGANKQLYSNVTNTEGTATNELTSFDSDGFSLGSANGVNGIDTYVGWNWKAGTAFSNDASATGIGNVDSSGQVNTEAGFSIVSWQFTNSADNLVAHGLSSAPEMMIIKSRTTAYNWDIYHTGLSNPATKRLIFTSGSEIAGFFDTNPTSTVFEYNTSALSNNDNAIAYCFHSVDGYSKVGSYTGNGLANGPFIYTGFRPAWIMIKNLASGENWQIHDSGRDPYNVVTKRLHANTNGEDITSTFMDFVSNGVKCRNFSGGFNSTSATFIYLAFAESPQKYSNAR